MKASPQAGTYHIWTIGCQMNEADSRRLAARLERAGFQPVAQAAAADVVVLNTCVVRQQAEDKIYGRLLSLRTIKEQRPQMVLGVMGCLVGVRPDTRLNERFPFVDVFMPPSDPQPLLDYLERRLAPAPAGGLADEDFPLPPSEQGAVVCAQVPAVLGCSHACSFCVIPYRRGPERSRPPAEILDECRRLADEGVREVTVLGQIVDRYGLDLGDGSDLAGLLERIAGLPGLARVRFLTNHPNWVGDRLLAVIAGSAQICPDFNIPFQSGNDEILRAMRRGYTADQYRRLLDQIRARLPAADIHTDIIVGFPGETDAAFQDTARLLADTDPDMARIAKYSPRPQTHAALRLADDVPPAVKEARRLELEAQLAAQLEKKNAGLRGQAVEVLVEARGKNHRWRGRTAQTKLVFFDDEREWLGRLARVRIDWAGPFSLIGRAADRSDGNET